MDNVWRLRSDPVVHLDGSLWALFSGLLQHVHTVFILVNSLNLSGASKPVPSLRNLSAA